MCTKPIFFQNVDWNPNDPSCKKRGNRSVENDEKWKVEEGIKSDNSFSWDRDICLSKINCLIITDLCLFSAFC